MNLIVNNSRDQISSRSINNCRITDNIYRNIITRKNTGNEFSFNQNCTTENMAFIIIRAFLMSVVI